MREVLPLVQDLVAGGRGGRRWTASVSVESRTKRLVD